MLIAAGIALAALSFGFPWFRLDFVGYTDMLESGSYKGGYDCYPEYFVFVDKGDHSTPGTSPWHGGIDHYEDLMDVEMGIGCVAILLSVSFMWAVLVGRRRTSLVLGSLAVGAALIAVAFFAFEAGESISIYTPDSPYPDIPKGFVGSETDIDGTDWSWGPSTGWAVLVLSAAMSVIALINQAILGRENPPWEQPGVKGQ